MNRKSKNLLLLLVVMILLTACGSRKSETAVTTEAVTETTMETTAEETLRGLVEVGDGVAVWYGEETEYAETKPTDATDDTSTSANDKKDDVKEPVQSGSAGTTKPTTPTKPSTSTNPTEATRPTEATKPTEVTSPTETTQPSTESTEEPTESEGVSCEYEDYMALSPVEQQKYYEKFASVDEFFAWLEKAKADCDAHQDETIITGNGSIDLGDYIAGQQ